MTPPLDLLNAVVLSWQLIPEVVELMNDDETAITTYTDSPPLQTSVLDFVYNSAPRPSIIVSYGGLNVAGALEDRGRDRHTINAYIRCADESSFLALIDAMVNGVATDVEWRFSEIHEDCYPVGGALKIERIVNAKGELDFWMLSFLLVGTDG